MKLDIEKPLIVTRHKGLVEVLCEDFGLTDIEVITHASIDDVRDRNVIGILPIELAAFCETITVLSLNLPPELRGVELNADQVREYMGELNTYTVNYVG